ncbi:hypothetical protein CERSUDRAFT_121375 [Gelatoporia subvermispora B]|uniref:ER membrane protein complex subunit 10 n=1 Tax=Ceriporiopsis subvermispora (strain B) TaxID=914234 RepID=M2RQG2_CERS8|nr:hypothetical protein CERSUDRAFT_121375 [Gelatoporia subvermispora B]
MGWTGNDAPSSPAAHSSLAPAPSRLHRRPPSEPSSNVQSHPLQSTGCGDTCSDTCGCGDISIQAESTPTHASLVMLLWLVALSVSLPFVRAAASDPPDSLRLFHRIYRPSIDDAVPFLLRADFPLATAALPSLHSPLDLLRDEPALDGAFYQLALEHPGDTSPAQWAVAAVKACHLLHATSEDIRVHLTAGGAPFALDYFAGPVPHDGACPRPRRGAPPPDLARTLNASVAFVHPHRPPRPQLRVPPPLTPEGKPAVAPPEKSFLQKYWVYIVVALLALVLAPAQQEEEGAGPAGGAK